MARRTYRSAALAAIHGSVMALHKVGAISNETLRQFDETCLTAPPTRKPQPIERDGASRSS